MKHERRWLLGIAVASIGLAAWAVPRDRPAPDELARCRASEGAEVTPLMELYVSSRVRSDGVLESGSLVHCEHSAKAARVYLVAHGALARVPRELRPDRVVIHLDPKLPSSTPALGGLETHLESSSIFARSTSAIALEPSAWLHELAHLRARGSRPRGRLERRIFAAIEEGVADYYAATVGGSSRLGSAEAGRDLARPPAVPPEYWVTLSQPSFDPHVIGWEFAAALWKIEKAPGPLLRDLLDALSAPPQAEESTHAAQAAPLRVARSFVLRCPERSREVIASALGRAFGFDSERIDR